MNMAYVQIETTFANIKDAEDMAGILLSKHLIACGQYYEITSLYNWEGKRQKESEILLKLKTQAELYGDCEKVIKKNHPYKTPQITFTSMDGSKEYLEWMNDSKKVLK